MYLHEGLRPHQRLARARARSGQEDEGVNGITAADAITGEYDVIAVCEAPDVNSIGSLIVDKIQKIDGVFKTVTCLAVK